MPQLSQIWNLLRKYVRGSWLSDTQEQTLLETEAGEPLEKINKKPDKQVVEYSHNHLCTVIFQEKLQISLEEWTKPGKSFPFKIRDQQFCEAVYDLLGDGVLRQDVLQKVMERCVVSHEFRPVRLFERLADFYQRWCRGEFVDAAPENNLPQQKMLKMRAHNISLGLRRVDINTGLNVMILLFELHRYAQKREDLKQQIIFYPSGRRDTENFFTSQLLRIINYSDTVEIGNFSSVVGQFLQGGDFGGAYLGDANLTSANFSNADLSNAYLGDANLTGANFSNAHLCYSNLGDANLSGANFNGANLKCADLSSSNLGGANLSGANLSRSDLSSADLSSADLRGANLIGANLTGANLKDAVLGGANLRHVILFGANLSDANLSGVDLKSADLCRADLSGAVLSQAMLEGTNLSDSILFSTNLKEAILIAADLSYAKLNGANLNGANLKNAILQGADLTGVDLTRVILNAADLSGVLLSEADLSGADLSNAILFGTDLSYANLDSTNFHGSNLSGANLSYANLSSACLNGADLSEANLEQITWSHHQQWEDVRGLEKALNVPNALKDLLGLT